MTAKADAILWLVVFVTAMLLFAATPGCTWGTPTVFVPSGKSVRLASPVKSAWVWAKDSGGTIHKIKTGIPAGVYIIHLEADNGNQD